MICFAGIEDDYAPAGQFGKPVIDIGGAGGGDNRRFIFRQSKAFGLGRAHGMIRKNFDSLNMGIMAETFGNRIEMIGTIVKSGDEREADDDGGACGIEAVEVVEDGLEGDAGPFAMAAVVHVFEVEKKEAGPGDQCGKIFPRAESAGFKTGIQAGLGGRAEQFQSKGRLGEGFTAAQRDAAARVFIKAAVAKRNIKDFRNGSGAPRQG